MVKKKIYIYILNITKLNHGTKWMSYNETLSTFRWLRVLSHWILMQRQIIFLTLQPCCFCVWLHGSTTDLMTPCVDVRSPSNYFRGTGRLWLRTKQTWQPCVQVWVCAHACLSSGYRCRAADTSAAREGPSLLLNYLKVESWEGEWRIRVPFCKWLKTSAQLR